MLGVILYLAFLVFVIASIWKVIEKAGEPGWAAIVPFYNIYVLCKIAGIKNWWLVFIPLANIYIFIVLPIKLAISYGKDVGFGIGLLLLGFVFYPILGFGDAKYVGPNGVPVNKSDDLLSTLGTNQ